MFGSIEMLVSFSSIWFVCVIVGCRMMVWLRSYQGKCIRWRSRGAIVEGFAAKKISSVSFLFCM
jgi:hypothetical protein